MTEPDFSLEAGGIGCDFERVDRYLNRVNPSAIVVCNSRLCAAQAVIDWAARQHVAVIARRDTGDVTSCESDVSNLAGSGDGWPLALDLLVNNVDERVAITERPLPRPKHDHCLAHLCEQL